MGKCQSVNKPKNKVVYYFYSKNEDNPWLKGKKCEWEECDQILQKELKYIYSIYLKNPKEKFQFDVPSQPNFTFDFKTWNRINKETKAILPFKKEYMDINSNILRAKKQNLYLPIENLGSADPLILTDKLLEKNHKIFSEGKELENFRSSYNFQSNKNIKKMYFNVIEGHQIEIITRDDLSFFENNYSLELHFSQFIMILKDELITFAKLFDDKKEIDKYLQMLETTSNSYLFFDKIIEMFNYDGFLKLRINEILHNSITNYYENIKLFYITLLASLKNASMKISTINSTSSDISIYVVNKPVKKVLKFYEANGNSNINRVFNEFLLGTKSEKYAKQLLDFSNSSRTKFFWEIRVPSYLIQNENETITFCEGILPLPNNNEVILKSGTVIYIDSITPYKDEDNKLDLTNKYHVKAILRSFSFDSYFQVMKIKNELNR